MSGRAIVFDTETTGFDPHKGHRIVEFGAVELMERFPTGEVYHCYFCPERDMPEAAFNVHGLSEEFLADKPLFAERAREILEFIGDACLIAHNAAFDMNFLRWELDNCQLSLPDDIEVIDTLALARKTNPVGPNKLDDLCARFNIDLSRREKHGALLDAELLTECYIQMTGGSQRALALSDREISLKNETEVNGGHGARLSLVRPTSLPDRLTPQESQLHEKMIESLGNDAIWLRYR